MFLDVPLLLLVGHGRVAEEEESVLDPGFALPTNPSDVPVQESSTCSKLPKFRPKPQAHPQREAVPYARPVDYKQAFLPQSGQSPA